MRRDVGGDEAETMRLGGRRGDDQNRILVYGRRGRIRESCLGLGGGAWRRDRARSGARDRANRGGRDEKGDYAKICGVKLSTSPAADVLAALSCA